MTWREWLGQAEVHHPPTLVTQVGTGLGGRSWWPAQGPAHVEGQLVSDQCAERVLGRYLLGGSLTSLLPTFRMTEPREFKAHRSGGFLPIALGGACCLVVD